MEESKKVEKILYELYESYGSGYGVLFNIPANLKYSVRAVIKVTLKLNEMLEKDEVK